MRKYVHSLMMSKLESRKENRQRLEFVNSKLVNELAAAKLSAKQYMQDYQKERKDRELIEEVYDELANDRGVDVEKEDGTLLDQEVTEEILREVRDDKMVKLKEKVERLNEENTSRIPPIVPVDSHYTKHSSTANVVAFDVETTELKGESIWFLSQCKMHLHSLPYVLGNMLHDLLAKELLAKSCEEMEMA